MSGPKVVRIVTREEIVATCLGQIAALEAAYEQWRLVGERNDILDETDVEQARDRIKAMRTLLATDKFTELQKQVPAEISFLESDMERRIELAAAREANARREDRRRINAAEALAAALSAKGVPIPTELTQPEKFSSDALQAAIRVGFSALAPDFEDPVVTESQRELASRLGAGAARLTLSDWLAGQTTTDRDIPALQAIERRFEELRALDPEVAEPFAERIDRLQFETESRRKLLIDSLNLDIASARSDAEKKANLLAEIRRTQSELRATGTSIAEAKIVEISAALGRLTDIDSLNSLLSVCKETLAFIRNEQAEVHRRRAILGGLADLGYEVKEGMETAWVNDGRVVMKSTKSPGYGVELGGDPAKRMQLRTVGFKNSFTPRNTQQDIAAETQFCSDFKLLQERLAEDGSALSIVKALGVGTTPVKSIEISGEDTEAIEAPVARSHNQGGNS
ncbi:hypothetical protein [Roseibium sp. Sym1]|uniref:hypothetical protein n=1 Tax=Roseibium sp. Sym1 TaxID=3016006 RepID=UPI0022B41539|nr:hypothetical protein [Roseibium sp. Sym1]